MATTSNDAASVNKNPLNSSTAKQLFSFSKANRFENMRGSLNDNVSYNLPSTRSLRSTSFGYGSKILDSRRKDSPSPDSYRIPSDFDFSRSDKNKGFSFRVGWKAYTRVYQKEGFKNTLGADPNVPGPGTYKPKADFGTDVKTATLKGKFKDSPKSVNTPGPGAYKELSTLPKNGKNFYSKFKSINTGNMGPPTGERFKDVLKKVSETPGPGQYSPRTDLAKTGQYFLSKFKSPGTTSLYHSKRETMKMPKSDRFGPGPGSYILPSDFGYPKLNKIMNRRRSRGVRSSLQL